MAKGEVMTKGCVGGCDEPVRLDGRSGNTILPTSMAQSRDIRLRTADAGCSR
jgi:hypothetical protein